MYFHFPQLKLKPADKIYYFLVFFDVVCLAISYNQFSKIPLALSQHNQGLLFSSVFLGIIIFLAMLLIHGVVIRDLIYRQEHIKEAERIDKKRKEHPVKAMSPAELWQSMKKNRAEIKQMRQIIKEKKVEQQSAELNSDKNGDDK